MSAPLHHLVVGPDRHGVTRYAELLLAARPVPARLVVRVPHRVGRADVAGMLDRLPAGAPLHVHVTDHLFGSSPEEALEVLRGLAAGRALSITLHDLPQASDGAPWARRRACYAGIARVAHRVVVSSEHEARLLHDVLRADAGATAEVDVVPLAAAPVGPGTSGPSDPPEQREPSGRQVGLLGFVYPGKGHAEVLRAMSGLPDDVVLRVMGGASPGHEALLGDLVAGGAATGRRVLVDGWIDDKVLPGLLRTVTVPVFAPRHVSASASLVAWTAAGRRPVATSNPYTDEFHRRSPGALLRVEDSPGALAAGLRAALLDPASTWTDGPATAPDPAAAAAATYREVAA